MLPQPMQEQPMQSELSQLDQPQGQMPQDLLTQQPGGGKQGAIQQLLDGWNLRQNPLEFLSQGPLSAEELVEESWNLDQSGQLENELSQLQEREGVLLPQWWQSSPRQFLSEFLSEFENYLKSSSKVLSGARVQLLLLETLHFMNQEHHFDRTT